MTRAFAAHSDHLQEIIMRHYTIATLALAGLAATALPVLAQSLVVAPGMDGAHRISRTGVGPDSAVTGYSEEGRGGTGGTGGGPTTNGTAAGAGTATGGNPSGYPDRN